jgi:DHA2 family multidrug resistance protein-like MFS transporter
VITFQGRGDNLALRDAAIVALGFNLMLVLIAVVAILRTIPGKRAMTPQDGQG